MSLMKKRRISDKGIAANRANGSLTHGPATPKGRTRVRESNTRHGFYSEGETEALACLGEDPAELERLRTRLYEDLQIPNGLEQELAEHLVQVFWRWRRAGCMQEGYALRRAKDENLTREDRLHAQMMRLRITADTLRQLGASVAHQHYITKSTDLAMMKRLHLEGVVKEMGEIALDLFYRLEERGDKDEDGLPIDEEERARLVVAQVKSIFCIGQYNKPKVGAGGNLSPGRPLENEAEAGVADATPKQSASRYSPVEAQVRGRARLLLQQNPHATGGAV